MITYSTPTVSTVVNVRIGEMIDVSWPDKIGTFGIAFFPFEDVRKVYDCAVANIEWRKSDWLPSFEDWKALIHGR